jgi:tetratricopeptide (TPR) repeat protein
MIAILVALILVLPLTVTGQEPRDMAELRALASSGSDSVLIERVRQRPDDARKALQRLLARAAVGSSDSASAASLAAAHRLAGAVAVAWRDSFLLRQVARFQSLSLAERQATIAADSTRSAGDIALKTSGIESAIPKWRESLRRFEALGDTSGIARGLGSIGWGFFLAQELDSAEAYLTRSREIAERFGNLFIAAQATADLGNVSDIRGQLQRASELYTRASELMYRLGDARGQARVQNSLGILAARRGDLVEARRAFEGAFSGFRAGGYPDEASQVLPNLAHLAKIEGDYAGAESHLREALSILRGRRNRLYTAATLKDLGALLVDRGDYPEALAVLSEAAGILRHIASGPQMNEIDVRVLLANVRAKTGDLQAARTEVERAETIAARLSGGRASLAVLTLERGNLALKFNRFGEAERHFARAERLTVDQEVRQAAQYGMGVVLFKRESYHRAQIALERLLHGSVGRQHAAETRLMIGQAAARRGDPAAARQVFDQALDSLRSLGALAHEAEAWGRLGDLEAAAGRSLRRSRCTSAGLPAWGKRRLQPSPGSCMPV